MVVEKQNRCQFKGCKTILNQYNKNPFCSAHYVKVVIMISEYEAVGCTYDRQIEKYIKILDSINGYMNRKQSIIKRKRESKKQKKVENNIYKKPNGMLYVQLTHRGNVYYLGQYEKLEDARKARNRFRKKHKI